MKNLLIFINPFKNFDEGLVNFRSCSTLVKVQIDNSLDLGWKAQDIILVTNFPYQYNGVKAIVIDDSSYCPFRPLSTKTVTVSYLHEKGLIDSKELYWVHDFDAYQVNPFQQSELGLDNLGAGFTDYGWSKKWSLGSYFFKASAQDLFKALRQAIYEHQIEDERAFGGLTRQNVGQINDHYKKINITYNFGMRHVGHNFAIAEKPLKVAHFHPYYHDNRMPKGTLDCFMYGQNELNEPLLSPRLIKIFQHHGIK